MNVQPNPTNASIDHNICRSSLLTTIESLFLRVALDH